MREESSGEGEGGKGGRDRESVGKGGREGLRREGVTKRGEVEGGEEGELGMEKPP